MNGTLKLEEQVEAFNHRWADAELHADADALSELLDPTYICVGPAGFVINKEQYLAPRRTGDLMSQAFDLEDLQIRLYGDTAVVTGTQAQQSSFQGRDASGRFRATQVLVRKGDGWVMVSLHLSPIPPAPRWIIGVLQAPSAA